MKAIIISDQDARALVDRLELAKYHEQHIMRRDPDKSPTADEMHRWFHFVVVKWLQEQGADVTR